MLVPRYRSQLDGRVADSPVVVAGSVPTVDLAALAGLFTGPGLHGEFAPGSYWREVDLLAPTVEPSPTSEPLRDVFAAALADLCADADAVGICLSGGLDSLAVLVHTANLRPRRRIVAYCTDLIDDAGVSAATVARRLLGHLDIAAQLVVVDPRDCNARPTWSPLGPRMDALPAVNATVAERAAADRLGVLLGGDGADELFAVPRYATGPIATTRGWRAALRYLRDVRRSGPGAPGEVLALAANRLPARARLRLYWAANWPEWCEATVSPVVAESVRHDALAWATSWIDASLGRHVRAGCTWAEADAHDAFWPYFPITAAGSVTEASPFLHEDVVAAALALPPSMRYASRLPMSYQRCKSGIVELLPESIRPYLPPRKQYYTSAVQAGQPTRLAVPIAEAAGLLDPDALAAETDVAVRINAAAVEEWLAGAIESGYTVPGVNAVSINGANDSCAADPPP